MALLQHSSSKLAASSSKRMAVAPRGMFASAQGLRSGSALASKRSERAFVVRATAEEQGERGLGWVHWGGVCVVHC